MNFKLNIESFIVGKLDWNRRFSLLVEIIEMIISVASSFDSLSSSSSSSM